jgi:formylglycine-generating enzyme required for sulfatase activity
MQRKIYRNSILGGLIFLLSLSFPTGAASKSGYVEVIVVPNAHILADGNPMTLKPKGKTKLIVDVGSHTIAAELDGYVTESKNVDVLPGKKYKVILALLKTGQDRNAMASISGGTATIGVDKDRVDWIVKRIGAKPSDFANAVPACQVELKDYKIDKYEVSNEQYRKFVQASKRKPPKHWRRGKVPIEIENYPVVNVSYSDAVAYCKWKGKRLPTEAEWEYAARGDMEHIFPWGKKFRDGRANLRESGYRRPTDTGRYERGVAKFSGCYDLSGNAWEWTSSWYDACPGSNHKDKDFGKTMRVIRGGSFRGNRSQITAVFRGKLTPDTIKDDVGFRCAK